MPHTEAPAAEPVEAFKDDPVAEQAPTEATSALPTESKGDAPTNVPATDSAATALPVEEKVAKDEVKVTAEPITKGSLGYKAPGLIT